MSAPTDAFSSLVICEQSFRSRLTSNRSFVRLWDRCQRAASRLTASGSDPKNQTVCASVQHRHSKGAMPSAFKDQGGHCKGHRIMRPAHADQHACRDRQTDRWKMNKYGRSTQRCMIAQFLSSAWTKTSVRSASAPTLSERISRAARRCTSPSALATSQATPSRV